MNEITRIALLLHVASTLSMVGLIWFVQIVHYPLLARVGREDFAQYELDHQKLTTRVVAPLMLTELGTAIALLWWQPTGVTTAPLGIGLALLISIWAVTYAVQVPQHAALTRSYDSLTHRRLVQGNWFRTIAWSGRGALVLWIVHQSLKTSSEILS